MHTFSEIIDSLGGSGKCAEILACPLSTAASYKARNSIPAKHWPRLIEAARERKVKGVSLQLLADLAARQERAA